MKTLDLTEEKIRILLKILRSSSPDIDEQEAVFELVEWLENILRS